jgi:hypothetical protein
VKAASQKLRAKHAKVVSNMERFRLYMEVGNSRGVLAPSDEAHHIILNELKLGNIGWLSIRIPDGSSITEHILYQGLIGYE